MRLFSYFQYFILVLAGSASAVFGKADFSHPKYHLGHANFEGRINLWVDVCPLVLSDGTEIPLRLKFSSEPTAGRSPFGKFWFCPVLESIAFPKDANFVEFRTLGGRTIYFRINKNKEGEMSSGDGRYHGKQISPTKLLISGEGWEYEFINGRLKSARKSNGVVLEWIYNNTQIQAIVERNKGEVLSLEYAANEPLPVAVIVNKKRFDIKAQKVPVVEEVMGQTLISGYDSTIAEITGGVVPQVFPIQLDREGNYTMDYQALSRDSKKLTWGAASGILKSDGEWTYEVLNQKDGIPLVARKNSEGGIESYFYDSKKGVSEHRLPSGGITKRRYFIGYGPTQYKIRNLTKIKNGKELLSIRWSYNELGQLIRKRSGDREWTWDWHSNGTLAAASEKVGEKLLEAKFFDAQGKIREKTRHGATFRYFYEDGKTIIQRLVNEKIVATTVNGLPGSKEVFFTVDSEKGTLVSPSSQNVSSEEFKRAESLAVKLLGVTKN